MVKIITKRIIPCLDVTNGRVVKGVNFVDLIDAGDPIEMAKIYSEAGADELIFLDITATSDDRNTKVDLVKQVARCIFIPFTVGGGIRSVDDMRDILRAGADKVAINSAAIKEPELINKGAELYGRQCIVVAIDAKKKNNDWEVYIAGGRNATGIDAVSWAEEVERRGAGELLVTSMDRDGTKLGYDIDLLLAISDKVNIPVIASGGAGCIDHIVELFGKNAADAALAASIFHFGEMYISDLKQNLLGKGIEVRL